MRSCHPEPILEPIDESMGEGLHGWVVTSVPPGYLFRFVRQEMPRVPLRDWRRPTSRASNPKPPPTIPLPVSDFPLVPSSFKPRSSGSSNLSRTRRSGSGRASLGSLRLVILDGGPDSVFGQHRAVELDGGQTKLLSNLSVLDQPRIIQTQTPNPLGHIRATGNRTPTSKRLELDVRDDPLVVDLDLELHDVSTGGSADETGTDVSIVLVHRSDISGVLVVINDLLVVSPLGDSRSSYYGSPSGGSRGESEESSSSNDGSSGSSNVRDSGPEHFGNSLCAGNVLLKME